MSGSRLVVAGVLLAAGGFLAALWVSDLIGPVGGAVTARFYARVRAASAPPELPVLGQLPDFTLTGLDGKPVRRADLAGRVWVADFIFTHCAGPCPAMTTRMAQLAEQFRKDRNILLVTVTVDPERDTPAAMAEYAGLNKADPTRWWFLTGTKEAIWALSRDGFKLGAGANDSKSPEYAQMPFFHSTRFVLVDQQARVRAYYDGVDPQALSRLLGDARALAGSGGATSAARGGGGASGS